MTHDEFIASVLKDLYALDPTLRKDEPKLRSTVAALVAAKPDAQLDDRFAADLRRTLLSHSTPHPSMQTRPVWFLLPVAVLGVLVFAVIANKPGTLPTVPSSEETSSGKLSGAFTVTSVGDNGFGDLTAAGAADGAAESTSFRSQSGGGSNPIASPVPAPATDPAMGDSAKMMVPPDYVPTYYKYVYEGAPLELTEGKLPVLKRVKGSATLGITESMRSFLAGLIDLARFPGAGITSFNASQDREFGYQIYADIAEGMVSINQNWARWPHPESACQDEACWAQYRLQPSDVPADDEVIAIATQGLNDLGISLEGYGAPEVRNEWRASILREGDARVASEIYVPDSISVTWPLLLQGQPVYEEGGYASGLAASVNIRNKRLDGVWGLTTQDYQSSNYEAESDPAKILAALEKGGIYGYMPETLEPNAKVIEIKLGQPIRVMMKTYTYSNGKNEELFAPALAFPTTPPAGDEAFRPYIVIPLVKDLYPDQPIRPMPIDAAVR